MRAVVFYSTPPAGNMTDELKMVVDAPVGVDTAAAAPPLPVAGPTVVSTVMCFSCLLFISPQ